jgi:hypothetical protein
MTDSMTSQVIDLSFWDTMYTKVFGGDYFVLDVISYYDETFPLLNMSCKSWNLTEIL